MAARSPSVQPSACFAVGDSDLEASAPSIALTAFPPRSLHSSVGPFRLLPTERTATWDNCAHTRNRSAQSGLRCGPSLGGRELRMAQGVLPAAKLVNQQPCTNGKHQPSVQLWHGSGRCDVIVAEIYSQRGKIRVRDGSGESE